MTDLDTLAEEVGVSGRTLRRAALRGLLHGQRRGRREVVIPPREGEYARSHWPLLSRILETLRKQPNVRLATLFGSVARGSERPDSDIDLLVSLRTDDYRARVRLGWALEEATKRAVQLASVEQAKSSPMLLADALRDGRVLVDRDGDWAKLERRRGRIVREARQQEERFQQEAWAAPDQLDELSQRLQRKLGVSNGAR